MDNTKYEFDGEDEIIGMCAELFITRKQNVFFQCSLCYSVHCCFRDMLEHVVSHNFNEFIKIPSENSGIPLRKTLSFETENADETESLNQEPALTLNQIITDNELNESNNVTEAVKTKTPDLEINTTEQSTGYAAVSKQIATGANQKKKSLRSLRRPKGERKLSDLQKHIFLSHGEWTCDYCGRKFNQKEKFTRHIKSHRNRAKCKYCEKSFSFKANLKEHEIRIHLGVKNFVCTLCSKRFATKHDLKLHNVVHAPECKYVCATCGRGFARISNLNTHTNKVHRRVPKILHQCDICDKTLTTKQALKQHLTVHSDARNVTCDFCDSRFKTRAGLNQHMQIHRNKRQYVCIMCSKGFNQKAALRSHLKGVHKHEIVSPTTNEASLIASQNPQ